MKRAFTLIEIIVAVAIVMLVSGGALVYLNNFINRQKIEKAKTEAMTVLKLAQSYARTRQLSVGSTDATLRYVQVRFLNNRVTVGANGIGSTFSNRIFSEAGVLVNGNPNIYFLSGGFLARSGTGPVYGAGESVVYVITDSLGNSLPFIINSLGQVSN